MGTTNTPHGSGRPQSLCECRAVLSTDGHHDSGARCVRAYSSAGSQVQMLLDPGTRAIAVSLRPDTT